MTDDRANIKVSREFFERHNERRKELGLDWEEYIDGQAPDHPDPVDYGEVERRARRAVLDVIAEEIP